VSPLFYLFRDGDRIALCGEPLSRDLAERIVAAVLPAFETRR
jgi:hypothetical protein